jgi:hypothetical protein
MLEKYFLRRPDVADHQSVLDLMIRCDIRDFGEADSELSDLQFDWKKIDLDQDAWLAFNGKGALKGYGAVLPWRNGRRIVIYDDPGTEEDELFLGLLFLCEGRAAAQLRGVDDPRMRTVRMFISDTPAYQKKYLEAAGYSLKKYIFNMHIDLDHQIRSQSGRKGWKSVLPKPVSMTNAFTRSCRKLSINRIIRINPSVNGKSS